MIHVIMEAWICVRKIGKFKEMDILPAADPASIVRSIHAPKDGASTSVRGNVLFNVTLDIVGCNQ